MLMLCFGQFVCSYNIWVMFVRDKEKPIVRRYIVKQDSNDRKEEVISFDDLSVEERRELLNTVFSQGLERLGYRKKNR